MYIAISNSGCVSFNAEGRSRVGTIMLAIRLSLSRCVILICLFGRIQIHIVRLLEWLFNDLRQLCLLVYIL